MTVSLLHSVPADGSFSAAGAAAWDAQHVLTQATDRLLGRTTAGVGATEEITVGAGLTLSGGTLINAGATSPIGGSNTQVQFNDGGVFAGNANFTFDKATNQVAIAAGTAAAPTLIPTGDTNTGMWFPAADTIAASTGGSERMRIDSSGNVGIGTSSPIYKLEVIGAVKFSQSQSAGSLAQVFANSSSANNTTKTISLLFEGADTIGTGKTSGSIVSYPDQADYIGAGLAFSTRSADAVAERMRITSSGNVGIGTSSPTTLLSVNGIASFGAGTAALPSIAAFGDLDTGMWFPAANTLAWSTGGSERMRIRSDGNIGIGTTGDAGTSVNIFRNLTGATTMYVLSFSCQVQSDVTSSVSGVFTNIGTANASFTTSINHFFTFQGTFGASSTVSQQTGYVSGPTLIGATTNYAFRAANTAAVGAGKTAYGYYSAINTATGGGTTWAFYGEGTAPSYFAGQVQLGAGSVGTPSLAAFGDTNTGMWFPAADTLAWSTGGSERMRITSAGNLGLGTSTFGTSAATTFAIATGTAPTTGPADTIQIYSTDLSAGNTMLSLYTEGTVVNANTTAATTHRIAIRVNGTVYYLLANTTA